MATIKTYCPSMQSALEACFKACVWNLLKKLLDEGYKYCALYADCANAASNKVYQKIGYKEVFWYDQYKVKEV